MKGSRSENLADHSAGSWRPDHKMTTRMIDRPCLDGTERVAGALVAAEPGVARIRLADPPKGPDSP